jgi:hypothetical protein
MKNKNNNVNTNKMMNGINVFVLIKQILFILLVVVHKVNKNLEN